jgi:hypothetical protein
MKRYSHCCMLVILLMVTITLSTGCTSKTSSYDFTMKRVVTADNGGFPEDISMRLDLKENNIACVYEKNQPSGSEKCGTYNITGKELRFDIPGNQMFGGYILENGDISLLDWSTQEYIVMKKV